MRSSGNIKFLFLPILFLMPSPNQVESCLQTDWSLSKNETSCPDGLIEAYKMVTRDDRQHSKMCCDEASVPNAQRVAMACKTTDCIVNKTLHANPCSTIDKHFVDGGLVAEEYSEELRDDCVDEKSGIVGVAAVCCPPDSADALLVSAYGAENNEFPHQAKMTSPGHCGGTIYNKDYIITAAHCITDDATGLTTPAEEVEIVLGTNFGGLKCKNNTYKVSKVIPHFNYSKQANHTERTMVRNESIDGSGPRYFNDIALLKLNRSIDFKANPQIRALEIAPANFNPSAYADQVVIVGWGTTDTLTLSEHLQKTNLIIRTEQQCFKPITMIDREKDLAEYGFYYYMANFSKQLMCIGGYMDGEFSPMAGAGDSGGPAICRGADGHAVHCGVTSFGTDDEACRNNATDCGPSVYAAVSYFRDWIVKTAGPQDPKTFYKEYLYGEPVPEGKYINQVHITSTDGKNCSGTIVSEDTILTAGHCVKTDDGKERPGLNITLGLRDLTKSSGKYKHFVPLKQNGVRTLEIFSRWNGFDSLNEQRDRFLDSPYINDIAVVKLSGKIPLKGLKISEAKLPKSSLPPGPAVEVAFPLKTNRSGKIMEREFNILTNEDCQKRLDRFERLNVSTTFDAKQVLCGVEKYSGGSICDRELGGGVFCKEEGTREEVLCGIQIFRMCDLSLPNAFLNITNYMDFIKKNI